MSDVKDKKSSNFKVLSLEERRNLKEAGALEADLGEETISQLEIEYNTQIDGLSAVLSAAQIFSQRIAVLAQKIANPEEKQAWQNFERNFIRSQDLFEEFWQK